mmetsp:Transcript_47263/g.120579  ORF Transcript_47263/g.120579 Transcript_47263/m.120579 type:complete len:241 (-) Transcript_47263:1911-2633(-)
MSDWMSGRLRAGSSTVAIPACAAASTFSFTPPTGSTSPRRLSSPVMATSPRSGRPEKRLSSAAASVTPAEGPSLGMAPAGKWTCTSLVKTHGAPEAERAGRPSRAALARSHDSAICADSPSTSPSWPVSVSRPSRRVGSAPTLSPVAKLGGDTAAASTNCSAPPTGVHTSPAALPGPVMRSSASWPVKRGGPSTSDSSASSTATARVLCALSVASLAGRASGGGASGTGASASNAVCNAT